MDVLGLVDIPSWIFTILLFILTLYLYTLWKHTLWRRLGVPGPIPFPILGSIKDLAVKGVSKTDQDLVPKYGSVVGVYNGTIPVLLVTDTDLIKEIFIKEYQTFTNRVLILKTDDLLDSMITAAEDDHWKFIRSTMTPTFTSGKLKNMLPMILRCCDDLVNNINGKLEQNDTVEMTEVFGGFTLDVIASTAFGLQVNSQKEPDNEFVTNTKKTLTDSVVKPYFVIVMIFPFLKNLMGTLFKAPVFGEGSEDFFRNIVQQLVAERKSNSNSHFRDFIQLMLNSHKDKTKEKENGRIDELGGLDFSEYKNRGMNENEILTNSMVFFGAGFDTTKTTLSFAAYVLALHPDMQERLFTEIDNELGKSPPTYDSLPNMKYLEMFLAEVLRLYAAVPRINRRAKSDITVNGMFIPKDTDVTIPISALHRNPKYWPEPEKFDPERFTDENKATRPMYSYLPFGLGPRVCIGMRLALIETKYALISTVQNFKFVVGSKTEIPMPLEKGFITRPLNGIHLKIEKR
ncbi:cytochrome P450 3A24-like [Mytilus edulis]|uniref:cytochrome P450 3A24-like n=1 Tax=Mytilus edulis TaxID=6550 RepID=UPI0039F03684